MADPDEPTLGRSLPRAHEAQIDPRKLTEYSLDPCSRHGRHKARVFARALGIGPRDWVYLRDAILAGLPDQPATSVRLPRHSDEVTTWGVAIPIRGLNGRVLLVRTTWKVEKGFPELTSAMVAKRRHQPPA